VAAAVVANMKFTTEIAVLKSTNPAITGVYYRTNSGAARPSFTRQTDNRVLAWNGGNARYELSGGLGCFVADLDGSPWTCNADYRVAFSRGLQASWFGCLAEEISANSPGQYKPSASDVSQMIGAAMGRWAKINFGTGAHAALDRAISYAKAGVMNLLITFGLSDTLKFGYCGFRSAQLSPSKIMAAIMSPVGVRMYGDADDLLPWA